MRSKNNKLGRYISVFCWFFVICALVISLVGCGSSVASKTEYPLDVRQPRPLDRPVLWNPSAKPSGILPNTSVEVIFQVRVSGRSELPNLLFLDEVDLPGNLLHERATVLQDDGKDADELADDLVYSGTYVIPSEQAKEGEKYYRVRAEHFGESVTSGIMTFGISSFPRVARPSDTKALVKDSQSEFRMFSNEVVITLRPGVSSDPDRIRKIAAAVGGTVVGVIPSVRQYLLEIPGDGTEGGVQKAIAILLTLDQDVENAHPNHEVIDQAVPSEIPATCTGATAPCQWYVDHIGIRNAWKVAGGGSASVKVNVLEQTGIEGSHPDLMNQCQTGTGPMSASSCSASGAHGTWVAGAVGAEKDNGGIAGVAWGTKLRSIKFDSSSYLLGQAIEQADQSIINISQATASDIQTSVENAITEGRLIVAAAGDVGSTCPMVDTKYPAAYNNMSPAMNKGILAVGATDINNHLAEWGGNFCSNSAGWIDIYAPGKNIYTTNTPTSSSSHTHISGTSMATPIVAGAAALIWALHPKWTAEQVHDRIVNYATVLSDGIGIDKTTDQRLVGKPLLNVSKALFDPYDIVFVLDRSGSMVLPTSPISTLPRWQALQNAVNRFTDIISTTALPNSRFGLTLFAGNILPNPISGLIAVNSSLTTSVSNALNVNPSGTTAMGAGLQNGMAKMTDPSRPRVIVLFTDGEQNVNPMVTPDGCQFINPPNPPSVIPNCPAPEASSGSTKINTIGINDPSSLYLTTLINLAENNRGKAIITSDGTFSDGSGNATIDAAFSHVVAPALAGNSPQVVKSYNGTLSIAAALPPFDLNKNVSQLLVSLSFSRNFTSPELATILDGLRIIKDGVDITDYFQRFFPSDPTNSALLKTDFSGRMKGKPNTIPPEGSYTIQTKQLATQFADLGFKAITYADDHLLDLEWQVSPVSPRVNRPFNPTLNLSWRGKPVTNANVEAWILKPGDDMGDLLAKHPQKIDLSKGPDAGSPGHQKYIFLLQNDPKFLANLNPSEQKITLIHQGNGQYSAPYNPGDVSGIYQILYRVRADDSEFGKIQRQAVQSVYVRFGDIDLDESAVKLMAKDKNITINFRPVTTYGRFIGPAQGSAFSVVGAGVKLSGITDHQDGSYTMILAGNPDAKVSVKLLGEEIYQGPAAKFGERKSFFEKLCDWLKNMFSPPGP